MAKIHDKFVIELAEVIKGYGNDPDVDDPFKLSEFYRFYELPEIAVSAKHFKTMMPLESAQPERQRGRWIEYIPEHGKCPFCGNQVDLLNGKANNFCGECGADMREGQDERHD